MNTPALLRVLTIAAIGVLHTSVPDRWVPTSLLAGNGDGRSAKLPCLPYRQGTGHVVTTLIIGLVVGGAGVGFASRFGHVVDTAASLALVLFGGWIAFGAWRELRRGGHGGQLGAHHHHHGHDYSHWHNGGVHEPQLPWVNTDHGPG